MSLAAKVFAVKMFTVKIMGMFMVLGGKMLDMVETDFLQIVILWQPTKQADGSGYWGSQALIHIPRVYNYKALCRV